MTNPRNVMSWNGLDVAAAEMSALFGPQLPVMNTSNTQPADAEETRTTLGEDKEPGIKEDIIPII